jgi:uncharacterized membrane protein YuzA (DUF378 family)
MKKRYVNWVHYLSAILLIVGGLNWLLIGTLNINLVESIFGIGSVWTQLVYVLVGISALIQVYFDFVKKR